MATRGPLILPQEKIVAARSLTHRPEGEKGWLPDTELLSFILQHTPTYREVAMFRPYVGFY